jgi:hypothetical protein
MSRSARVPVPTIALDQDCTLVVVLELGARSWLVGARMLGAGRLSPDTAATPDTAPVQRMRSARSVHREPASSSAA